MSDTQRYDVVLFMSSKLNTSALIQMELNLLRKFILFLLLALFKIRENPMSTLLYEGILSTSSYFSDFGGPNGSPDP